MPLKPIFEKSPLTAYTALPLCPGQVNVDLPQVERLLALCEHAKDRPMLWEGMLRASAAVTSHAEKLPVAAWIEAALELQAEDGSLPYETLEECIAVVRAGFALYECTVKRTVLEKLALWCGFAAQCWEDVLACDTVRQHPADLMGLLADMYRVTGKKPLLTLMDQLRREAMDWSGVLHTFAVQRPMSRVTPWADMEAGLEAEEGSEQGFYTRQYLTCHGESLADGARSAAFNGLYSGNGMELTAVRAGWERISRYHGAACGGLTCNENLAGTSPSEGVDAAALGAWAEAFCLSAETGRQPWAFDALEIMLTNAMARAVRADGVCDLQRVNGLSMDCGDAGAYHLHEGVERAERSVNRLLRGYAAVAGHAVMATRKGLDVNLLLNGKYALAVDGQAVTVTVSGNAANAKLTLRMKQPAEMNVSIRVPGWGADASAAVNGGAAKAGKPGEYLTISRTWQDGDVIDVKCAQTLRTVGGHHQSVYVMRGAELLVMPAAANTVWAMGLCSQPAVSDDGSIQIAVAPIAWRKRGAVPADLPVLPKAEGTPVTVTMAPYAEQCGIALFPQVTGA